MTMSSTPSNVPPVDQPPSRPPGVMPKHAQAWGVGGLARGPPPPGRGRTPPRAPPPPPAWWGAPGSPPPPSVPHPTPRGAASTERRGDPPGVAGGPRYRLFEGTVIETVLTNRL